MPISQKNRPVGLLVVDMLAPIPLPWMSYPRPEDIQYTFPSRGNVIQTFDGGFVDDFGEGLADIVVSGNTGWNGFIPGEVLFYDLRDLVVLQYHALRKAHADAGLPIDLVGMYWVDTLHMQVYEVYPVSLATRKNKQNPLLYQYTLRLTGIKRRFGLSNLISTGIGALAQAVGGGNLASVGGALANGIGGLAL